MSLRLGLYILMLMYSSLSFAGEFAAEVSSTSITMGESIELTLTVTGDHDEEPQLPEIDGLEVMGRGTSTNISIINGNYTKSKNYSYSLIPLKEGRFVIPSLTLKVDGEQLKTLPVHFKVLKLEEAPSSQYGNTTATIFIRQELSNASPYINEPIIVTNKIYYRVQMEQSEDISTKSSDFRVQEVEGESKGREIINGMQYETIAVKRVVTALSSGEKVIPAFRLKTVIIKPSPRRRSNDPFWDFFGGQSGKRVQKIVVSPVKKINVKPLPPLDGGRSFSGLVGEFSLSPTLSHSSLKQGETATLTIKLSGNGSLYGMKKPKLSLDPTMKVYADKPTGEDKVSGTHGVQGSKIFKYALVPTSPGKFDLGVFKITVFNPKKGQYEDLEKPLGLINVSASNEQVVVTDSRGVASRSKKQVKALGSGLLDLHRDIDIKAKDTVTFKSMAIAFVLSFLSFLFFIFVFFNKKGFKTSKSNLAKKELSLAHKEFLLKVKDAASSVESLQEAYRAYKSYLGLKLGVHGGALTGKEIEELLTAIKAPEKLKDLNREISVEFEKLEYAAGASSQAKLSHLCGLMESAVKMIEKVKS